MEGRKKTKKVCICLAGLLVLLFAFIITDMVIAALGVSDINGGPVKLIYDYIGHYELNYTGNTNNYDYWDASGTSKLVSKNYKDVTGLPFSNNSSAKISKTDNESKMVKAFLIWQTRAKKGVTEPVILFTPDKTGVSISAEYACKDTRTNSAGQKYTAVYTMATDVTEIVCGANGGYGTYTVANIPVWNGAGSGVACGGESVASWQLVVVEESPNFPLRTISLNLLSQYFYNVDYTVNVDFADASSPNGEISATFIDGHVNVDSSYTVDGMGYPDDYNYIIDGNYLRYKTQTRGLYKNGVCINNRDTGAEYQYGSSAVGAIRVHMYDDKRRLNSIGSHKLTIHMKDTKRGNNIFLYGVAIDIFAYDVIFDGNGATGGSMDNLTCVYGRDYYLPENKFEKQYYEFTGWNTQKDGSGTFYEDADYIRNLTSTEESVTLYAQWVPKGYNITLDDQDATVHGTFNYFEWYGVGNYTNANCTTEISKVVTPFKKGYTFGGYYGDEGCTGKQYIKEDGTITATSTEFEEDTTLYAKWVPNVYKIILDNQEADTPGTAEYYEKFGVGNYTTRNCTTTISKITNPTKKHYTFEGYFTQKDGEGQEIISKEGKIVEAYTFFEEDTTLFAYWEPVTYTITLDGQEPTTVGDEKFYEKYGVANFIEEKKISVLEEVKTDVFSYTGGVQTFIAPYDGVYTLECIGAGGAYNNESLTDDNYKTVIGGTSRSNSGAYTKGTISLKKGEVLYVYVGGAGDELIGGWNGGGDGKVMSTAEKGVSILGGGGATDIRKDGTSLTNRIIVAGGGGGSSRNLEDVEDGTYQQRPGGFSSLNGNYPETFGKNNNPFSLQNIDGGNHTVVGALPKAALPNQNNAGTTEVGDNYTSEQYTFSVSTKITQLYPGSLGQGNVGGGGGLYGGGYWVGKTTSKANNVTSTYVDTAPTGIGGSSYIGGVSDGVAQNSYDALGVANIGHGKAYISYIDYSAEEELKETTSVTVPKKLGLTFGGYWTEPNGEGTCWVDEGGNILSKPDTFEEDTTLYAHWYADYTYNYRIVFNGNGATEGYMTPMNCNYNTSYTLNPNTFTKRGYKFTAWNTEADGSGKGYEDQGTFSAAWSVGNIVTLYAQWEPNQYKIHFDANGGVGYMEDITVFYDDVIKLPLNAFTKNNDYGNSEFLGWNILADTREVLYKDGAEVINVAEAGGLTVTLYAVWDDCPWIVATDQYYSLQDAQNGLITYDELMSHATASDLEDGENIPAGVNEETGTSFTIIDYLPTDFTFFTADGSVTETFQVIDSVGNSYKQMITVYIVDTEPKEVKPEGTTRFINEKYYYLPYEEGGLEDNSIWKVDPEYVAVIEDAFRRSRENDPEMSFYFTYETILKMKEFIRVNGIVHTIYDDALQRFYDEFMVPNIVSK